MRNRLSREEQNPLFGDDDSPGGGRMPRAGQLVKRLLVTLWLTGVVMLALGFLLCFVKPVMKKRHWIELDRVYGVCGGSLGNFGS